MTENRRTPPWQSKLIPYQKEILNAWFKRRATLKMIQADLAEKKVEISLSALSRFIKRRKFHSDPHAILSTPKKKTAARKSTRADSLDELLEKSPEEIKREWFRKNENRPSIMKISDKNTNNP